MVGTRLTSPDLIRELGSATQLNQHSQASGCDDLDPVQTDTTGVFTSIDYFISLMQKVIRRYRCGNDTKERKFKVTNTINGAVFRNSIVACSFLRSPVYPSFFGWSIKYFICHSSHFHFAWKTNILLFHPNKDDLQFLDDKMPLSKISISRNIRFICAAALIFSESSHASTLRQHQQPRFHVRWLLCLCISTT
jgi:hypothetical protein